MKKFNQWYNEAIDDGKIIPPSKEKEEFELVDDDGPEDMGVSKLPSGLPKPATGLGSAGRYAGMAAKAGAKKTYNLKQIESLVDTFVSQFSKPSEQRQLVRLLRKKLLHAKDMFKPFDPLGY